MKFFDKFLKFVMSLVVTSVLGGLVITALLPKGLSLRQLPNFYKLIQNKKGNVDAFAFLETLQNEEESMRLLQEMHGVNAKEAPSIATQQTNPTAVIDPAEFEKIDKMNISNELKQQMKLAYAQVGSLPKTDLAEVQAALEGSEKKPEPGAATNPNGPTLPTTTAAPTAPVPNREPASIAAPSAKVLASEGPKSFEMALRELKSGLSGRKQKP